MNNQYPGRQSDNHQSSVTQSRSGTQSRGQPSKPGEGRDPRSQITEGVQDTTSGAKRAAAEAASTITGHVKDLLDTQLASGADIVGQFGNSAQRAAEDLEKNAPQLAGLVRGIANRIEDYADNLREQSVDELIQSSSNFARRQPALVFGLAALAGFFALRTVKSTALPSRPDPGPRRASSSSNYHGA
jgi:hypothetical protein